MNAIIEFLVQVFAFPAAMIWRHPSNMLPIFLIFMALISLGIILKKFEARSNIARISKKAVMFTILFAGCFWLPASVVLSVIWVGGH